MRHINGCIANLSPQTLENEFKLTNRSYLAEDLKYSEWFSIFKDDLYSADAIFFLGFSMAADLDLARVFENTKELKEKSFFIVGKEETELQQIRLADFGAVLSIGTDGFVKELKQIESSDRPSNFLPKFFKCFSQPVIRNNTPTKKWSDFSALLVKGELDEHILDYSIKDPINFSYFIHRDRIEDIMHRLQNGKRYFIIKSDLGNGKTILLKALSYILKRKGFSVFFFERELESVHSELEEICSAEKPTLIFDNYSDCINILRSFNSFKNENCIIFLSERTNRYETTYSNLDFFEEKFEIIDINELTGREIEFAITLFDKHGIWGKRSSWDYNRKYNHITNSCEKQIGKLILSLLDSPNIQSRYAILLNAIKGKQEFYQSLLYILYSKLFDFRLEYRQLVENIGDNSMNNPAFKNNASIREFVNFDEEKISFRSSILANHILHNHIKPKEIIDHLIILFHELDKQGHSRAIKNQLKALMNYGILSKILGPRNKHFFQFYENIAECKYCNRNPQFWLQFAIARLTDEDYSNADICFNTAYGYAENLSGYDTYQIDTHHARFLLERAIHDEDYLNCMSIFQEAHRKLMTKRRGDEYRHYIYKIAQKYGEYYSKFRESLDQKQYINACSEIYSRAQKYLSIDDASNKELVLETQKILLKIISAA